MLSLDSLLQQAAKKQASDLHLIADLPPYLRINGILTELDKKPIKANEIEALVKKSISDEKFEKFIKTKELDLAYEIPDGTRFRINFHWEKNTISLAARTIPLEIPTMEDVEMPEIIYDLCSYDRGLVLLTGPTGCGKSTSLAAMINYINQNRKANIITLEDPIEFVFKPIKSIMRQRQLGNDMLTFEDGLVHVLRQDPNVIMVGEMRNLETIAATITLAETGHLVFATLHTYSAAQTIDRIIDIFPPHQQNQVRMQISITLKGIISQRLLPSSGEGRVAAREILINTPAIANLIRENKVAQINTAIQTGAKEGMITMDSALGTLLKKGEITQKTMEENMSVAKPKSRLLS
ncbi:PilT/PilU family type 4a pilus ATPase [Candidatus Falkowbacteria bacterium]|uniref:Type IV pili twitching motility protein PilT n=1 Tax=Candidatus Buchananbacteria bacterium CG10_big_fil_rev_8_21_14_0_10_33_19 TaxID=1974525 RepID=A0A2H0W7D4_9BACT|nr:PilT/PilU family type 4a pilus ATPase [Candidatus Falkowbacteria bacterium]PIS06501.1 MAG: type IV pili twitching motility protein PilT [Candidatus Buchananbacteria bacterium CG10_big_fil_rev_8_21_14_0_10_33_19]